MTPKEKAEQLINAFVPQVRWKMGQEDVMQRAKECALIAVNEIEKEVIRLFGNYPNISDYYQELKQEIEKL
jgi:hypothetical protein